MRQEPQDVSESVLKFGPFELFVAQKLLLKNDAPVRVGGRAMDLLIALVEHAGELLSRSELEARAWPRAVVEETSLRVHMSALRRALDDGRDGARYIANVPGRGYCFVAPVDHAPLPIATPEPFVHAHGQGPVVSGHLPTRLTSMVGRDAVVAMLAQQVPIRRLITVVGSGGIGKTTVALAVAERVRAAYSVCFVDLSLVADAARVPSALAAAFGMADFQDDPLGAVSRSLRNRQTLLVLDNCEHVIEAVAGLASGLLTITPQLRLLATSREPIGVDGEWLHRLPALGLPSASERPSAAQALEHSAVQLFVERASANVASFRLADADAPVAAELCRRLDGMPLAIEVAAARLEQFGLRGLIAQIDEGFLRLQRGRRTGLSRHEALAAMLDWSHRLLSDAEQIILRRLAIFRSPFSMKSAIRVASDATLSETDVVNGLAGLRTKSLLNRVVLGDVVKHQLLEHTRVYALEKLTQSGDEDAVRRRHAMVVTDLLGEAQRNWPLMPKRQWVAVHGSLLLAIHTVSKWAFSSQGDPLIGASLVSISWPMARYLFLDEHEPSIERAIEALTRMNAPPTILLIRLYVGLATHVQERLGTGAESRAAYEKATALARDGADPAHQIEAQIGQVLDAMGSANAPRAVASAGRMKELAIACGDEVASVVADRLTAQALHLNGEHTRARRLALTVRSHAVQRAPLASLAGIVDHRVSMGVLVARALWLEGCADQAARIAEESLELAETDSDLAMCQALALAACPIALWRGDNDAAQTLVANLLTQAQRVRSGQWLPLAQGYQAIVDARRLPAANRSHRQAARAFAVQSFPFAQDQLAALDDDHWHEASLARANQGTAGWCAAEIWRLHGHRLWASGALHAAEEVLLQSLALANAQNALAWSLRTANSLARLSKQTGRISEAHETLEVVYRQFTEGAGTTDLVAAAALLDELRLLKHEGVR